MGSQSLPDLLITTRLLCKYCQALLDLGSNKWYTSIIPISCIPRRMVVQYI